MAIKFDVPNDHTDPYWNQLASNTETKLDLPVGMLQSIISHGERSNNDQVSEKGARSPFQIIPATRTQAIKKWGIDPYLSPENAAEVSGLLLKDSLTRNKGDVNEAVGEYHGGTDRKNWGRKTREYQSRVADGMETKQADRILAYLDEQGKSTPTENKPKEATKNTQQEDEILKFIDSRKIPTHTNTTDPNFIHPPEEPGMIANLKDSVTGELRKVPGTEAMPTLDKMPELRNAADPAAWSSILGKLMASPEESAMVIQSNFPNVKVRNDEKGNFIFTSPTDGKDYAIHPGLEWGDLPRTAAGALLYGKGAALKGVAGAVLGSGLAQGAIEASQAATGGEFNPDEVAKVALMGGAPGIVKDAYSAAKGGLSKVVGNRAFAQAQQASGGARSASAAATPMETQQMVLGEKLLGDVPMTKAQITNSQEDQMFEKGIAKSPTDEGKKIRDQFENQNTELTKRLDESIDNTGTNVASKEDMGKDLSLALKEKQDIAKRIVGEHYAAAEVSPEASKLVAPKQLVNYLNLNSSEIDVSPAMTSAKKRLIKLGGATEDVNGNLVAKAIPLKEINSIRQSTNAIMKNTGSDSHYGSAIKRTIDDIFDKNGGDLYRQAASLRREQGRIFGDKESIKNILGTKFTQGDRKIALEKIFQKSILGGSNEDVKHIRRTLQTNGKFRQHMSLDEINATAERGKQAWGNIQGMLAQHIKDEAFKGTVENTKRELILSAPGLKKALRTLDENGKLETVFGKNEAQHFRDIAELAGTLKQSPPGTVNSSDTATILLAALDTAISGIVGVPVPISLATRHAIKRIKNAKLRERVNHHLNYHRSQRPRNP